MDKEAISAIITEQLTALLPSLEQNVRDYLDTTVQPLAAGLDELRKAEPEVKVVEESDQGGLKLQIKGLVDQLEQLKQEKQQEQEVARKLRYSQAVSESLDKVEGLQFKNTVKDLVMGRIGEVKEVEGIFLASNGKQIGEAIKDFFDTDEGKYFIKANVSAGIPGKEGDDRGQPKTAQSLSQAVLSLF